MVSLRRCIFRFSRIRSKITMVPLTEYPTTVNKAAIKVESTSNCISENQLRVTETSMIKAMIAATAKFHWKRMVIYKIINTQDKNTAMAACWINSPPMVAPTFSTRRISNLPSDFSISAMTCVRSLSAMTGVRINTPLAEIAAASSLSNWMIAPPKSWRLNTSRTSVIFTSLAKPRSIILPPVKSIPRLKPRKIMEPYPIRRKIKVMAKNIFQFLTIEKFFILPPPRS